MEYNLEPLTDEEAQQVRARAVTDSTTTLEQAWETGNFYRGLNRHPRVLAEAADRSLGWVTDRIKLAHHFVSKYQFMEYVSKHNMESVDQMLAAALGLHTRRYVPGDQPNTAKRRAHGPGQGHMPIPGIAVKLLQGSGKGLTYEQARQASIKLMNTIPAHQWAEEAYYLFTNPSPNPPTLGHLA